jgi:hypothetical protein
MEWAGSMFQVVVEVCTGADVLAIVASFFIHFIDLMTIDIDISDVEYNQGIQFL